MKLPISLRSFGASLFTGASLWLAMPAVTVANSRINNMLVVVDNAAQHPNFTVRIVGKGRPVLLIPGLTCPGAVWDETVARYQKQYQCHVVSINGFGDTAASASTDHLLQNVRDQLLTYIKTQQLRKPIVIGHSLGGFIGLWMSATQPEAVGPLLIVDSLPFLSAVQNPMITVDAVRPMAEGMRQQVSKGKLDAATARQTVAGLMTDTARIRQATRWSMASDPATVAQAMYDMYTTDLRQDIARIQQPVLVLGAWAAYQQYGATQESTRAIFEQQYAKLPQHQIEMSAAGKHFLMWDDPQWFFVQTDAFLKQHSVVQR